MKRWRPALVAGALLAAPGVSPAHSLLLEATPAADAVLTAAPSRVSLRFNNRIEKALSRLTLVGSRHGRQPLTVIGEGSADRLIATVPVALPPDTYRLEWSVLSADGHVVTGRYAFRIAP